MLLTSRVTPLLLLLTAFAGEPSAEAVTLAEPFKLGHTTKVEVQVKLTGKLALPPTEKGKAAQLVEVAGTSKLVYEEPPPETRRRGTPENGPRLPRGFLRAHGGRDEAGRGHSAVGAADGHHQGRRAEGAFSPDGPMTWGEIDVVRTDVFNPLIPGLLPATAVKPGQSWKASAAAVAELTDMEKIEDGSIAVEFVGIAKVNEPPDGRA